MWHPIEDNAQDILDYEFQNYSFKFTAKSPMLYEVTGFSNVASDWLVAVFPTNQKAGFFSLSNGMDSNLEYLLIQALPI